MTRDSIITLCAEIGVPVKEKRITRDEGYIADECCFRGTAVEVTRIREVDGRVIGGDGPGPITRSTGAARTTPIG